MGFLFFSYCLGIEDKTAIAIIYQYLPHFLAASTIYTLLYHPLNYTLFSCVLPDIKDILQHKYKKRL